MTGAEQPLSKALVSLAVLNVEWDAHRRSYFDNFVAFAVQAMRADEQPSFDDNEVAQSMREIFGITVQPAAVGAILGRVAAKRLGHRLPNGRFALADDASSGGLEQARARLSREQENLVLSLQTFAEREFGIDWDEDTARLELFEFVERNAPGLLRQLVRGLSAPPVQAGSRLSQIAVARWIESTSRLEPNQYSFLENLIKGSMLATAVFGGHAGAADEPFRRTTLYLDTPVILAALGFDGEPQRDVACDVMRLARGQRATLACFEDTVTETRGVMLSAALRVARGYDGVHRVSLALVESGATRVEIEARAYALESELASLRVEVRTRPGINQSRAVDEVAFQDRLATKVRYDRNPAAVVHDVKAIVAVRELRRGRNSDRIERCGSIFVTTNADLVLTVRKYPEFSVENSYPYAVTVARLAEILWVKNPVVSPDLPYNRVLADCYTVLAPPPAIWAKYDREIERLNENGAITLEQVALARHSRAAIDTLVLDTALTGHFRPEVVQNALRMAEMHASEGERRRADNLAQNVQERDRRIDVLESRVDEYVQLERAALQLVDRRAAGIALVMRGATWGLAAIVLLVPVFMESLPGWVRTASLAVAVLVALAGGVSGPSRRTGEHFASLYRRRHERRSAALRSADNEPRGPS